MLFYRSLILKHRQSVLGTRNAILSGLLHQAVVKGERFQIENILKAIQFFND